MYYRSQSVVLGTAFVDAILAAMTTRPAGALMVSPKVRLNASSTFSPQVGSLIADFTANETTYSGYTSGGVAYTPTGIGNLSAAAQAQYGSVTFAATAATPFVSGVAYGWWIDDGTNVLWAEKFTNGFVMSFGAPGDYLVLDLILPMQQRVAAQ